MATRVLAFVNPALASFSVTLETKALLGKALGKTFAILDCNNHKQRSEVAHIIFDKNVLRIVIEITKTTGEIRVRSSWTGKASPAIAECPTGRISVTYNSSAHDFEMFLWFANKVVDLFVVF